MGALICNDDSSAGIELCDGIDNDCDPSTPDGSGEESLGAPCDGDDADLCAEGQVECQDGALVCSDTTPDNIDLCDGVDNDCDPLSADGSEEECPMVPRGVSSCGENSCEFTCQGAYADCNQVAIDGCEVNTNTNEFHCGGCGEMCFNTIPNAVTSCVEGACTFVECAATYRDVNQDLTDGCEQEYPPLIATKIQGYQWHNCALIADGTVECWGENSSRQLGNQESEDVPVSVAVQTLPESAIDIGVGRSHSCALLTSGRVRCWGNNRDRQAGGQWQSSLSSSVAVDGITTATAIALGATHSCALLANGQVQCWGDHSDGRLGVELDADSHLPVTVPDIDDAIAIASGGNHSCALRADHRVSCWGNTDRRYRAQTNLGYLERVTMVATGEFHSCALLETGIIKCVGENDSGQIGDGSRAEKRDPVTVIGISNAVSITLGYDHSCALLATGEMKCWGGNSHGQLGDGSRADSYQPVSVAEINNAVQVTAGYGYTCALLATEEIKCWGNTDNYRLGSISNDPFVLTPVVVRSSVIR